MKQPKPTLVRSNDEVIENIKAFNELLAEYDPDDEDTDMDYIVNNLSSFRAWYAYWDEEYQEYLFGPSKYIGYKNMTPEIYNELRSTNLDGRKTEKVLSNWYKNLIEGDSLYDDLIDELEQVFSLYGKNLNALLRLSIVKSKDEEQLLEGDLIELIYKVYLNLSEDSREVLKKRILNRH